jgi:GT2 family glycosyltransferase
MTTAHRNVAPLAVTIVTYNSEWYLRPCLVSLLCQDPAPAEIVIIDNASRDGTRHVIQDFLAFTGPSRVQFVHNKENTGFSAAQNQAIALTSAEFVLTLNPDVVMEPGFLGALVEAIDEDPGTGAVCGKLLRLNPDLTHPEPALLDSTGMYFTRELRHFDRGCGEPDSGAFDSLEYVFGATAAAALYRREMIEDISVEGSFFDPAFFAYREDADVAWRAQLLGWRCLYTPKAVAYHVRQVRPGKRKDAPKHVNMHSVKNRFLLRARNLTPEVWQLCAEETLWRDLIVIGGCFLTEPTSLPAFWHLARLLPKALRQGSNLRARRRAGKTYLASWFDGRDHARAVSHAPLFPSPPVSEISSQRS